MWQGPPQPSSVVLRRRKGSSEKNQLVDLASVLPDYVAAVTAKRLGGLKYMLSDGMEGGGSDSDDS